LRKWERIKRYISPQSVQYLLGGKNIILERGGGREEYDFLGKYIPLNYNVPFDLNLIVKE